VLDNYKMEKWIKVARTYIGLKEYPGTANNPTIMGWAKSLGTKILGIAYGADSVPWCGLFVAHCIKEAGLTPVSIAVRASAWEKWGQPCKPTSGAVVVFTRSGGGHVGFLVGENEANYRVLGGNQSDAVNETWIAKSRCSAIRWPAGMTPPTTPLPKLTVGGAVSKNEA